MKNALVTVLTWLSGKKNIIAGVIMTTSAYLAAINVIDAPTAAYVNAVTTVLFGSASIATGKFVYNK